MPHVHSFEILDVFAETPLAGNQLAVVYIDLTEPDAWLQRVAAEFGFSETVFLPADLPSDGPVPTRIFTPVHEMPFAGHPTLGAAFAVQRHTGNRTVSLAEKVGTIETWTEGTDDPTIWMRQVEPEFLGTRTRDGLAGCVGLGPEDIAEEPEPEIVSTGVPFLIVRLTGRSALARAAEDSRAYGAWWGDDEPHPVFLYTTEAEEPNHGIRARMFASLFGIVEDPATGSASGCLAAHLLRRAVLGPGPVDVAVEQGYEMGRPSVLHLRAEPDGAGIAVQVGGGVRHVASGELSAEARPGA
jgi:trans-2,3-dihydro-3-hydroxyanthranilate isomerase